MADAQVYKFPERRRPPLEEAVYQSILGYFAALEASVPMPPVTPHHVVRAWLIENGYKVPKAGPVSYKFWYIYEEAHTPKPEPPPWIVREWLLENGHEVSRKGRLSAKQWAIYEEAHKK